MGPGAEQEGAGGFQWAGAGREPFEKCREEALCMQTLLRQPGRPPLAPGILWSGRPESYPSPRERRPLCSMCWATVRWPCGAPSWGSAAPGAHLCLHPQELAGFVSKSGRETRWSGSAPVAPKGPSFPPFAFLPSGERRAPSPTLLPRCGPAQPHGSLGVSGSWGEAHLAAGRTWAKPGLFWFVLLSIRTPKRVG